MLTYVHKNMYIYTHYISMQIRALIATTINDQLVATNMTITAALLKTRVGASADEPGKVSNRNEWLSDVTPAEMYRCCSSRCLHTNKYI